MMVWLWQRSPPLNRLKSCQMILAKARWRHTCPKVLDGGGGERGPRRAGKKGTWPPMSAETSAVSGPREGSAKGFPGEVVPVKGLEPPTPSLRMTCSTS